MTDLVFRGAVTFEGFPDAKAVSLPRRARVGDALSKVENIIRSSIVVGRNEVEKSESLARTLRRKGIDAEVHNQGVDIVGVGWQAECKWELCAVNDLYRLEGQINCYYDGTRTFVVVFGDAKRSMLDDLNYYCIRYRNVSIITLGKVI